MDQNKEKNGPWLSVPAFGDWDQKGPMPDYSMDFSKIREMRKQNKTNLSRASLGNEEELVANSAKPNTINTDNNERQHPHYHQTDSPVVSFPFTFAILYFVSYKYYFKPPLNDGNIIVHAKNMYCSNE